MVAITPKIIPQEVYCVSNVFEGGEGGGIEGRRLLSHWQLQATFSVIPLKTLGKQVKSIGFGGP